MAEIFFNGKIYTGITEKFAPNFKDWNTYFDVYGTEFIPVIGTHSFKDGQDVTGLYEIQFQKRIVNYSNDGAFEWVHCLSTEYDSTKAERRIIAIPSTPPDELDREAKLIKFIENELLICEHEILNSAFLIMHDVKSVREYWKGKRDAYTTLKHKIKSL